ncbi:lysine-specific demethylase JMJ25 isoform X2 [Prunus yedoensis var. nudiflora]|uniref:Lysine-specific demethylase JMJ25 isoform X2 n=1 Tax=Prunus yedoensis var. nudiflora TaxID=2094558 RepID=A0A314YP67_PRUYE|nr:lysine-specific demethylase JMJ25 isoform X2 [Prunus yedoensis var. nudiflora]
MGLGEDTNPDLSLLSQSVENDYGARSDTDKDESVADHGHETTQLLKGTPEVVNCQKERVEMSLKKLIWEFFGMFSVERMFQS